MNLNHLDLQVVDVVAAVEFFTRHFQLVPRTRTDSPAVVILGDDAGFTLVLQRRADVSYPEGFHIGFIVDDPQEVYLRRAALAAAGLQVSEVDVNGRGPTCYCRGPSGVLVEVSSRKGAAPHV